MASRSFKPATSYLSSASAQSSKANKSSHRPSFARTSSSSSTQSNKSNKSDDSFLATLKTLTISDRNDCDFGASYPSFISPGPSSSGASPRCCTPTPVNPGTPTRLYFDDTPGRKRSQPISIELPARDRGTYTPLTARGDLPGGYFPHHEPFQSNQNQNQHKSHPFSVKSQEPSFSTKPQGLYSSTEITATTSIPNPTKMSPKSKPRNPSPPKQHPPPPSYTNQTAQSPLQTPLPETLTLPKGKYHPSNYKLISPALTPSTSELMSVPTTSLSLPRKKKSGAKSGSMSQGKAESSGHARRSSDVKRKLIQYQRDMIKQARMASDASSSGGNGSVSGKDRKKPDSPKLLPLGSPGPITPFELEEAGGYLIAGSRSGGNVIGGVERDREVVERLIVAEERRIGVEDGGRSPVLI